MSETARKSWWVTKKPEDIWADIDKLEKRGRVRAARAAVNERVYSSNISGGLQVRDASGAFVPAELNFTRTIVDALVARVADDRPAVHVSADGADWGQRRKARKLDQVTEGEIEARGIPQSMDMLTKDALVTPAGLLEIVPDGGRIVADRVPVEEFLYDEREARYGKPRRAHRLMLVSRDVLLDKFGDDATRRHAIMTAKKPQRRSTDPEGYDDGDSDMVEVAKSWHLPSGPEADDGKFFLSLSTGILDEQDYKRDRIPIVILQWAKPRRGLLGATLVDELLNLQRQVNRLAASLQQNSAATASLKIFVRRGAEVAKKKLVGDRPHYVEVDDIGRDVQYLAPQPFSPGHLEFLQWLKQQMYEVSGVSELMAQGKNPLGAGASGAALNEIFVQDTIRFSQFSKAIAQAWKEVAELIIWAAQDLAEEPEFRESTVRVKRHGVLKSIKWGDVDLEADRYELHLEASGYLPNTRGGKMQAIEQLIAAGMLDPRWAMSLIEFPDIKRAMVIQNAPVEWALWAMDEIEDADLTEDGEVDEKTAAPIPAPDHHMDLDFVMAVAKAVYQTQVTQKVPPAILARYLTFIDTVDEAMKKAQPANANAGAMPGAPPAADPMAAAMPADPAAALPPMPPGPMPGVAA